MTRDAVIAILQRLSRIEAQLGERCLSRETAINLLKKTRKRHEERLDALEAMEEKRKGAQAMLTAIAAVVGAVGGIIGAYLRQ